MFSVPEWVVQFLYAYLAIEASIVAGISGRDLKKQLLQEGWTHRVFMLAGIFFSWLGTSTVRWWFLIWLLAGKPGWMLTNVLLVIFVLSLITGGMMHIISFTREKFGYAIAIASAAVSLFGAMLLALIPNIL